LPAITPKIAGFELRSSLKPHHLKRHQDIALLLWKYGAADLAKEFMTREKNRRRPDPADPPRKNWRTIWKKWGRLSSNLSISDSSVINISRRCFYPDEL
jgi:hypothetical protein